MRFATAMLATAVLAAPAFSQISYNSNSFESIGYAWTDAGDEYAYSISAADEADPTTGLYTFSDYGQAPGYSSSASVGVTHNARLTNRGFHIMGSASAGVTDDYGYAVCTSNSEAGVYLDFNVTRAGRVSFSGTLSVAGSTTSGYSNDFEVRDASGNVVATFSGTDTISFSRRLPRGRYTVVAFSQASLALSSSGGDAYENYTASFDVTMTWTAR